MKTNITINLYEQLYHIDEDAYELLKQYEKEMQHYFKGKEGEEEILDDIEHRIAELLAELQQNGTVAVNIDHVRSIIQRIGKPEEIGSDIEETETEAEELTEETATAEDTANSEENQVEDDEEPPAFIRPDQNNNASSSNTYQQPPQYPPLRQRRLFRDVQNSLLGGVISGLCHYFGIAEPTWARIGWVICFFLFTMGFLGFSFLWTVMPYLVLWIVMPPAITPEDRLLMKGLPVTPENIQNESQYGGKKNNPILNEAAPAEPQQKERKSTFGNGLLKAIVILLAIGLGIYCVVGFYGIVTDEFLPKEASFSWNDGANHSSYHYSYTSVPTPSWLEWLSYLSNVIFFAIPIWLLGHHVFSNSHYSHRTRIIFLIAWCISILSIIVTGVLTLTSQHQEEEEIHHPHYYWRGHRWHCWRIADPGCTPKDFIFPTRQIMG